MKEIMGSETGLNMTCLTWKSFIALPTQCYSVYPNYCKDCMT